MFISTGQNSVRMSSLYFVCAGVEENKTKTHKRLTTKLFRLDKTVRMSSSYFIRAAVEKTQNENTQEVNKWTLFKFRLDKTVCECRVCTSSVLVLKNSKMKTHKMLKMNAFFISTRQNSVRISSLYFVRAGVEKPQNENTQEVNKWTLF